METVTGVMDQPNNDGSAPSSSPPSNPQPTATVSPAPSLSAALYAEAERGPIPPNDSAKVNVTLSGVSETLFITLLARVEDAKRPKPILGDRWAGPLLDKMDYAVKRSLVDRQIHLGCVLRTRLLDAWTTEYLRDQERQQDYEGVTVLHLGCGLDTRSLRVQWQGPKTRWIDVDVPEVVELRRKVLPNPQGDYRLLTSSVTDDSWLDDVPADRRTLVVMEGLVMYLTPADVKRLMARLCDRFLRGQIVFDALGTLAIRLQRLIRPVRQTGAIMSYGLDHGTELESAHSKLRLKTQMSLRDMPGYEEYDFLTKVLMWVYSWFPYTSTFGSFLRYEYGVGV
jgi:O-methyltransferase involved in polyketide biosynthesis